MINLLDLMTPEEKERAIARFERRIKKTAGFESNRVSNEIYILSEFGYYYGWEGIQSVRRNEISLPEVNALLEGARKVWYTRLTEQAQAGLVSTACAFSDKPQANFNKGIKPFMERSKV